MDGPLCPFLGCGNWETENVRKISSFLSLCKIDLEIAIITLLTSKSLEGLA
jgi:hypothetical protein